jgi:hypothetical protein
LHSLFNDELILLLLLVVVVLVCSIEMNTNLLDELLQLYRFFFIKEKK